MVPGEEASQPAHHSHQVLRGRLEAHLLLRHVRLRPGRPLQQALAVGRGGLLAGVPLPHRRLGHLALLHDWCEHLCVNYSTVSHIIVARN